MLASKTATTLCAGVTSNAVGQIGFQMREQLSSRLTIFFKIVFPIFGIFTIGVGIFALISHEPLWLFTLAMLLPIWIFIKNKWVTFDKENIYVYSWWTPKTYPIRDIKAINEAHFGSLDPSFEIEIREKDGSITKVDFLPKSFERMSFFFTKKYTGQLEYLKDLIIRSKRLE